MSHPISSFGPYLRPRRRFTFALVALLTAAGLCGCGNRWTTPIGGRWEIVTVQSGIPEAGDH